MVDSKEVGLAAAADITHLLGEVKPEKLLLVGPDSRNLAANYLGENHLCKYDEIKDGDYLDLLAGLGKFSAAIVAGVVECLEKHQAEILLSRIRDLHASRFWLLVPMGTEWDNNESIWSPNDLIAFGMVRVNAYAARAGEWHLYQYDLLTYKTTPEWYSNKYWANPAMWDKKWW